MKLVSFLVVFSQMIISLYAQNAGSSTGWFSVKEISPKTWLINDHGADNMYLLEGADSALLIDTGLGIADLVSQIRKITTKPLIVVNTHGHPDHSGSNYQFGKIYMHAADTSAAREFNKPSTREVTGKQMIRNAEPSDNEKYNGKEIDFKIITISEDKVFNLGGRKIKVIETPGHTLGSICLLDIENKFLFTGDCNNALVWAFLPGTPPLHVFLSTLEKQKLLFPEFNSIFPGHGPSAPNDFINDQIACTKSILDQTCQSKPYESFVGKAQLCSFGRSSIAYNPDNK